MLSISCFSGFAMALLVGVFYGTQFLAVEYVKLCDDELHSCNGEK